MTKALVVIEPGPLPHVPTRQSRFMVAQLVSFGLTEGEIAVTLAMQPWDLRKYYMDELNNGTAIVTARLGHALVKQGLKGDVNAIRLYMQARARWVPATKVEHTGKDGGPIEIARRREVVDSILARVRRLEERSKRGDTDPHSHPPKREAPSVWGAAGDPSSGPGGRRPPPGSVH